MSEIIVYICSAIIILWGIAHLIPSKSILKDIGRNSGDNNKIVTMEWMAEGVTLIFIGMTSIIVAQVAGVEKVGSHIVFVSSGVLLLILTLWSFIAGTKFSVKAKRICPVIKTTVAFMYILSVAV